jgi:1,4-alpha-glucan branching enzyme
MNAELYGAHPGIMTIAEESTSWPKVSQPVHEAGWASASSGTWASCTTRCAIGARADPPQIPPQRYHLRLLYAFSENFVLPLSHDEVVHGKGSLLTRWRATTGRSSPICAPITPSCGAIPGKKLLFMGQEFAQRREWSEARSLDWHLLDTPA